LIRTCCCSGRPDTIRLAQKDYRSRLAQPNYADKLVVGVRLRVLTSLVTKLTKIKVETMTKKFQSQEMAIKDGSIRLKMQSNIIKIYNNNL